jgi:hypothetical protein
MRLPKKTIKIILIIAIVIFIFSYFQKNRLPAKEEILTELYQAPIQTETKEVPFKVERGGIIYDITPLFNYELYGLVVSKHNSKNWLDYYHEQWEDFINLKDVCVVWGENIETGVYRELKFKNGSYTCYIDFKSGVDKNAVYQRFKNETLSNNHLLSADESINKKIMSAQEGDQIYLKGYLVHYSHDDFQRGSSITRADAGNGACETIYLTDFKIIKEANAFWRVAFFITRYLIIVSIIILLVLLFRGGDFKRGSVIRDLHE